MTTPAPSREQLLGMYTMLARIRAADEAIRDGVARGQLVFFYFPITGHEAIAAALSQVITKHDYLAATYRGFHHQLARGVPFAGILGEMTGKATAIHAGRSGPMHICAPELGMTMTTGIVGATAPPAVGMALASQLRKDGRVAIAVMGDGAINQGSFHEAANLASVWKLPVVFLVENNRFAETTESKHTYRGTIPGRAAGYEIPAETVDGYDPVALFGAFTRAVSRARAGGGPSVIDAVCFRYFGHYFGDPMITVPKEMLEAEKKKDPVETYTAKLVATKQFTADELARILADARAEAKAVVAANIAAGPVSAAGMLDEAYGTPVMARAAVSAGATL